MNAKIKRISRKCYQMESENLKEEILTDLIRSSDFKSQFKFKTEIDLKKKYGNGLYDKIYNEFMGNWKYELSERLDSIDIKALLTAAIEKALSSEEEG
tara:strand:- start:71 stop:364 length:294 start_codon:yes stop_codon:yes gene_type:complete